MYPRLCLEWAYMRVWGTCLTQGTCRRASLVAVKVYGTTGQLRLDPKSLAIEDSIVFRLADRGASVAR